MQLHLHIFSKNSQCQNQPDLSGQEVQKLKSIIGKALILVPINLASATAKTQRRPSSEDLKCQAENVKKDYPSNTQVI